MLGGLQKLLVVLALPAAGTLVATCSSDMHARADVPSNDIYTIDGTSVSLDQLVDEFLAVSLGRDGRILKWTTDRARVLYVARGRVRTGRSGARTAGVDELATQAVNYVSRETKLQWDLRFSAPDAGFQRGVSVVISGSDLPRRGSIPSTLRLTSRSNLTEETARAVCANPMCIRSSHPSYPPLKDSVLLQESMRRLPEFAGLEQGWREAANGRQRTDTDPLDPWPGHVWAWLTTTDDRRIGGAHCNMAHYKRSRWAQAEFMECFIRSLGFPGSSKLFPLSLLGVRLPERPDLFLGADGEATLEEYASTLPDAFTEFDLVMLRTLYDDRLSPGQTEAELETLLPSVVANAAADFLRHHEE